MTKPQHTKCSKTPILECKTDDWGNVTYEDTSFAPGDVVEYVHVIENRTAQPIHYTVWDELALNAASGVVGTVELLNGATSNIAQGATLPLEGKSVTLPPNGKIRFKTAITLKGENEFDCLPVPMTNCMKVVVVERQLANQSWEAEGNCPETCYAVATPVFITVPGAEFDRICFTTNEVGGRDDNDILKTQAFFGGDPCDDALVMDWLDSGKSLADLIRGTIVVGEAAGDRVPLLDAFGNVRGYLDTDGVAP